jgi:apoptosis-stimulating of p53 protein 1
VINDGLVYALYDYAPNSSADNELEFKDGDQLIILRRGDENETEWWWARHENTKKEGYVPRNYLGVSKNFT